MLDERAKLLLKTLVERYIDEGQPVASRSLVQAPGLELSAATIRHVMSDLEQLGLIVSPHTSAGRIPTARGYRLFVDTMLTVQQEQLTIANYIPQDQPQKIINHAAQMLSQLSQFVGVVVVPPTSSILQHLEFLRLGPKRVLLIIVTPDGGVQNRVVLTAHDFNESELLLASNFINHHYAGLSMESLRTRLASEAEQLRSEVAELMQTAIVQAQDFEAHAKEETIILSGERNLLGVEDFSSNIDQLRKAYELFEHKTQMMQLLESSSRAPGVRIFIGGESQIVPVEDLSVVSAPYCVNGEVVGRLGVIGPTRMHYDKMIQIVDMTARLVTNALSFR